jgi:predicted regulator of Ras-like GTPase activity (Roadblock/LC7/MglB family)
MDPAEAIADLKQVSTQVRDVAVATRDGSLEGSSAHGPRAAELARVGAELYADAVAAAAALGHAELSQLEIATPEGSVFVVVSADRIIVATTEADPTVGLVFYDLKACLRAVSESTRPVDDEAAVPTEATDGQA